MREVAPRWKGEAVRLGGLFLDGESGRFIAVDLSARNLNHIIAHEFSHSLVSATGEHLPVWLQEGLAEIFAAAATGESENTIRSLTMQMPTTQLLALREDSPEYNEGAFHGAFYAQAALAADYLWTNQEKGKRLLAYIDLTRTGAPIEAAIQEAFQVSGAELSRAVLEFASQRRNGASAMQSSVCIPGSSELAPIPEIDARARIAEFEAQTADHREHAIHEFETILRQSPGHEIALRGMAYGLWQRGDVKQASEYFRLAVEANPVDGKLQYLSAVLNTDGAHDQPEHRQKMRALLLKAISLAPEFADAYHWLSLTYAWDGNYAAASNSALRALELDPRNEQFKYNIAAFFAHAQRWSEARGLCQELRGASDKEVALQSEALFKEIEHAPQ
jgi:tetratricopeptide (TPR) repeat protein